MAAGKSVLYGLLSTVFTYALTALGAAGVFVFDTHGNQRKKEAAMAIATGLMIAAVVELLADAVKSTEDSSLPKALHWVPNVVGVIIACVTMWGIDKLLQKMAGSDSVVDLSAVMVETVPVEAQTEPNPSEPRRTQSQVRKDEMGLEMSSVVMEQKMETSTNAECNAQIITTSIAVQPVALETPSIRHGTSTVSSHDSLISHGNHRVPNYTSPPHSEGGRSAGSSNDSGVGVPMGGDGEHNIRPPSASEIRRAKLLVFALAVQHLPEALACGVAFASAVDPQGDTTMATAISLTLAIGLQDIPEGMAASFVLRNLGMPKCKAFFWGQLTGLIEPVGGVIGAGAVLLVKAMLPYALSFAGMAMLFVIVRDMVPDIMGDETSRMRNTMLVMGAYGAMVVFDSSINALTLK